MSGSTAIIKKEWRAYFYSPAAYIVIGLFLGIMGIIFTKFVDIYQRYNMAQRMGQAQSITLDKLAMYLYQNMHFFLCFMTPFITMRLFAEEKRNSTLELLFTAPIRGSQLVFGKFFAAYSLMLLMGALSFVYVVFMIMWGNPELPIIATTYLGLGLTLSCYVALGALISAMTASPAIAAIFTFVLLMLLWLMQSLAQGITAKWETPFGTLEWGTFLTYLSPLGHFNTFTEGLLHVKDVTYFLSFTVFILFLTHRVVESNRWR